MSGSIAICVAEDRVPDEEPTRLCVASACQSNPDCVIVAFLPNASRSLQSWLAKQPRVELRAKLMEGEYGWNVKPHALLSVIESGFECAWWFDSDVIVRRSVTAQYGKWDTGMFLATEEALSGGYYDRGLRARGWGLEPVRDFGHALNSGVLRASREHMPLLLGWCELLQSPEYRTAQLLEFARRPLHLAGDQDLLTALLCSEKYAHIRVRILRRGSDIVQYYGGCCYTVRERFGNFVYGGPTFVHSQGFKPWRSADVRGTGALKRCYRQLLSDTSIYLMEARRLQQAVELELPWTGARTASGRLLRSLGFGSSALTGLPLAFVGDAARFVRWASGAVSMVVQKCRAVARRAVA